MKRRKFTSKFKWINRSKLCQSKRSKLCQTEYLQQKKPQISESEEERDRLLKAIGELKVENDFLKKSLK